MCFSSKHLEFLQITYDKQMEANTFKEHILMY